MSYSAINSKDLGNTNTQAPEQSPASVVVQKSWNLKPIRGIVLWVALFLKALLVTAKTDTSH